MRRFLLGDHSGAIADFTRAVALMPASPVPFNGRGKAQLALKRPAGALRDFSRAIALSGRRSGLRQPRCGAGGAAPLYRRDQRLQLGDQFRHGDGGGVSWPRGGLHFIEQAGEGICRFGHGERTRPVARGGSGRTDRITPESTKPSPAADGPCRGADRLGDGTRVFHESPMRGIPPSKIRFCFAPATRSRSEMPNRGPADGMEVPATQMTSKRPSRPRPQPPNP